MSGDFLANVALACVGDLGMTPVAFMGAKAAIFQSTVEASGRFSEPGATNPSSILLAGVMLFDHLGWKDAADLVSQSLMHTVAKGTVTPDIAKKREGAKVLSTHEFCEQIVENFEEVHKSRVREAMQRAQSAF